MTVDLEFLRSALTDQKQHLGIGVITQTGLAKDFGALRVQVSLLPEQREVVAFMSFADVADITFPQVSDLVLVAFADGNPDEAHVVARFPATDQPIPVLARTGNSVKYARTGKKLYVGSDTKTGIARPGQDPVQPLVLGTVLVSGLTALVNAFLNASQVGQSAMGPVFLDPTVRSALTTFVSTYLTTPTTNIISQLHYTERGTE